MTRLLTTRWRDRYDEIVIGFANTGEERPETLNFGHLCDQTFGFNTVWVEADVQLEKGDGTRHRIVSYNTASRNGEPFEAMIKKYGIPNSKAPQCTRELKSYALMSYLRSIGWERGSYDHAIGFRADEPARRHPDAAKTRTVYPLMDWLPVTKPHVNQFWMKQSFRLELTGYQGNCKWCWKKSLRKHMTLLSEDQSLYDFPERMEALYGEVGAEFSKEYRPGYKRVFFRGNLSTKDLRAAYEKNKESLERAEDDSIILPSGDLFPLDLEEGGCVESCEVGFEEAA